MPRWGPPLLDWKAVHTKMSWGVLILLGGGFALADVCEVCWNWLVIVVKLQTLSSYTTTLIP